jgi:histone deacetylase 1/2
VKFVKSFNKPLLLLGGGGYTMRNVSRAWAYETGLATGVELGHGRCMPMTRDTEKSTHFLDIPVNEYYEYFGPDYQLDVKASNTEDLNTPAYLERVKNIVMDHLRHVGGPPSVQMTGIYSSQPPSDGLDRKNQMFRRCR